MSTPILDWCQKNLEVPDDDDQVFVGEYEYKVNDDDELLYLRIFITTKRLISLVKTSALAQFGN
jgi:hypothetical protein